MTMRIAVFSNAYKPTISGVVRSMLLFRKGLMDAGHQVYILAPEYTDFEDDEPDIFRFPAIDLTSQVDLSLMIPIKGLMTPTINGIQPDVIHSQHMIVMGNLANAFARERKVPLVFTFHTLYDEYAQKFVPIAPDLAGAVVDEVVSRYLSHCTHIIAPTPSIRDMILRKYEVNAPVTVIPTPVDLDNYTHLCPEQVRIKLGLERAEILLYLGRLSEEKNLELLLEAFAIVYQQRPDAHLVLVGKGPTEHQLHKYAEKLNITPRVCLYGAIPYNEVANIVAAADLFVFPSQVETQGLVLVEAMAAGTPVVAVECASSRDVIASGGGLISAPNAQDFAAAIMQLLDDPQRLRALSFEAAGVAKRYDIRSTTQKLIEVYHEAIDRNAARLQRVSQAA